MKKINYDTEKYNFVTELQKLFKVNDLSMIHEQWSLARSYDLLDDIETDQYTVYHKHFYDYSQDTQWYEVYALFLKDVIRPLFKEPILYQKIPTFRVHQPSNLAVAAFHKDSDYSHSVHEINFFLPMTRAFGNNTVWVESRAGENDYLPIESTVGECVIWDGANLSHGNKVNDTGVSRVSVDFRVLPSSRYIENDKSSFTNKTRMILGEYYGMME